MIEAVGLAKRYGRRYVLKDINFSLQGKVAVLGYNGAGKSTLAKIIAGILAPTEGEIRVFGGKPTESAVRQRIGIASHNPMLYRELTVRENLEFYGRIYGCNAEIEEIAKTLGFEEHLDRKVAELSRGYMQRVAMAKALINNPELLILDEVTAGLDVEARKRIIGIVKGYSGSVIFTTHLLDEASFCEHFIVLKDGIVRYNGSDFEEAVNAIHEVY